MKKLTTVLLAVILVFGSASVVTKGQDGAESVYEMNKKQTEAAISYITEMYIERYPDFGLLNEYGGEPDKKVLSELAYAQTEACKNDAEKAQALFDWVVENIGYHNNYHSCVYPIDVYYEQKTVDHGFGMLLSRLMRFVGIPAVVFDGLRDDLKNVAKEDFADLQFKNNSAWVMAYIDGKWLLYDPVEGISGNADRDLWEKRYFCTFIEGVSPYYDGCDIFMTNNGYGLFYIDGRTIVYDEGKPSVHGMYLRIYGMSYDAEPMVIYPDGYTDGKNYVDAPQRKDEMVSSQAYYDGFFTDGLSLLYYANPNGVIRADCPVRFKDSFLTMTAGNPGAVFFTDCETRQYIDGNPAVFTGETVHIRIFNDGVTLPDEDEPLNYEYAVSDQTEYPDMVRVGPDGSVTTTAPGYVEISCRNLYRTEYVGFYVIDAPRTRYVIEQTQETPATIYEMNVKQTEAAISYITEMYIEKYPEFGLVNEYGGEPDRKVLSDLAFSLTEKCGSDEEKAKVLYDWVKENITYDMDYRTCSYPIDVYYEGRAVCHGMAMLLSRLMRIVGIPAVVFSGLRGDMVDTVTKDNFVELRTDYGHGWVMAYLDGQWRMYDTLWDVEGETDRDFWEKWYFCTLIEGIAPYYDGTDIFLTNDGSGAFYIDGRTITICDGEPMTVGDLYLQMNGIRYDAISKEQVPGGTGDGWDYVDDPSRRAGMVNTQAYSDGFIKYGETMVHYAEPNGNIRTGCAMSYDGTVMDMDIFGGACFSDCETRQYLRGRPVVLVGETLNVKRFADGILLDGEDEPYCYTYSVDPDTEYPDSVTINTDGSITVSAPGYVKIATENPKCYGLFIDFYVLEKPRERVVTKPVESETTEPPETTVPAATVPATTAPANTASTTAEPVTVIPPEITTLPEKLFLFSGEGISSAETPDVVKYASGAALTKSELVAAITAGNDGAVVTVKDKDGKELADDATPGTGSTVTVTVGDATVTKTLVVTGDVDGDGVINASDARLALRAAAKLDTLGGPYGTAADTDGDSSVNAVDARGILRAAAKLDVLKVA